MNSTVQLIEMFSADGTIHQLNYSCMIFNFQVDSCILFKQHNTEQELYSIKHFQVNEQTCIWASAASNPIKMFIMSNPWSPNLFL